MPHIAIIRAASTDRWGDPLPSADAAEVVKRVKVWPRQSDEGEQLTTGIAMFIPARKPVPTADDEVLVGVVLDSAGAPVEGTGVAYQVVGDPGVYYSGGNGPQKGVIVNLEKVT